MNNISFEQLLKAGAHFGHQARKWNPAMAPYIFMERNNTHIIDLHKTVAKIEESAEIIKNMASNGDRILFVATKKQIRESVEEHVQSIGMPYVVERWPGGMLTNFPTIRKAVKKMAQIDKMKEDGTYGNLSKRERLQVERQRAKLEKNLGSIQNMHRLPSALFVVDINKEHIAVREATRLGIPVFAIVDTNANPKLVDHVIPANDASKETVDLIVSFICSSIAEGVAEFKAKSEANKEQEGVKAKEASPRAGRRPRVSARREKEQEEVVVEQESSQAE